MYVFMVFLVFIVSLFSVEFAILGAEYGNEDYPLLATQLYYFMQTFRNSIGDMAPPGYERWTEYIEFRTKLDQDIAA